MKRRPQGPKAVSKAARAEGGQAQSSIGQISEKGPATRRPGKGSRRRPVV